MHRQEEERLEVHLVVGLLDLVRRLAASFEISLARSGITPALVVLEAVLALVAELVALAVGLLEAFVEASAGSAASFEQPDHRPAGPDLLAVGLLAGRLVLEGLHHLVGRLSVLEVLRLGVPRPG